MNTIYYIWPHDFYWKNNVLGQRLIMLNPLGKLHVCARKSKRLPLNLGINVNISIYGLSSAANEHISLITYIFSIIINLTIKRLCGYITRSDIVYTNFEYSNIIGIWAKQVLRLKWVADFFDDPRKGYLNAILPRAPKWRVHLEKGLLRIYRCFLSKADLVICNSPDLQRGLAPVLLKQFMIDERKMVTVPAGVEQDYIAGCLKDPVLHQIACDLLQEKGIAEKGYIYIVGHFNSDVSGVDAVLKALRILLQEGFNYHLILAGFFKQKEQVWFESTVKARGLSHYVHYLGVVDQPLSYILMKKSGVCVCPYDTEGRDDFKVAYFIKLLEYLTTGASTISIKTPITCEIVNDFGAGELFSNACEGDIVDSLRGLKTKKVSLNSVKVPDKYKWSNINSILRDTMCRQVIN
jgi:glycosyltransferase involved in cell wall biosynthesis